MANKIRYGLKKAYYATVTETTGAPTYGTPVPIPGAVSISLEPEGEESSFYADDVLYDYETGNNGYTGTLEIALIPDKFFEDVIGFTLDNNDVFVEKNTDAPKPFALMFEFTGDANGIRHCLYNCIASRPTLEGETKAEGKEVQTTEIEFKAIPEETTGVVKIFSCASTDSTKYNAWYTTVALPSFPG